MPIFKREVLAGPGPQGPTGDGKEWVQLTAAEYAGLTEAQRDDPLKVYDIVDFNFPLVVEFPGWMAFEVDGSGDLICTYQSGDPPNLTIDGSGNLILTAISPEFAIDGSGNLTLTL